MTTCDSSLLSAFEYDNNSWTLTLVFRSTGEVRHYGDFPPELFDEFQSAKSKGAFFNQKIRGHFEVATGGTVSDEEIQEAVQETGNTKVYASGEEFEAELGITDADLDAAPGTRREPVADDLITKDEQESLSMPAKKQPQVDKKMAEWALLVPSTTALIVVRDRNHYIEIADKLKKKVGIREFVFGLLDPARDAVYRAYTAIQQRQKSVIDLMDASIKADKTALVAFDTERQRIAREAQQKAQREAEAEAERERQRRTEELRMQVAQQQAEQGDTAQAEVSLFDESIQAPPVPIYVPRAVADTPEIEGFSGRKNWKVQEVYDFDALIMDVAEGIKTLKTTGGLQGHAPSNMLKADLPALNKRAKADETINLFPGVRAFNDRGLNIKKEKE